MDLLIPDSGLLFWMTVVFLIVFVILRKAGFGAIVKMVTDRKAFIDESLKKAHEANEKLANIQKEGESILQEAREKQAAILKAEAERQAAILKAEGEAQAILNVQQALADSIKMLNEANPNDQVVKIKALESFEKAADGQATKIIVPSEIQSLAGLAASFKGLLEDEKK